MAVAADPALNFALISVPGAYAAAEAMKAVRLGLSVMVFSDNVPVEQELAMKTLAAERGVMVMGPDCGTAIVNGLPLGFANVVRRGPIGVVGASGTGMQEVTSRIHNLGSGVSQALGTGGHDLSDDIGGISMLHGLRSLEHDPATDGHRAGVEAAVGSRRQGRARRGARHEHTGRGRSSSAPTRRRSATTRSVASARWPTRPTSRSRSPHGTAVAGAAPMSSTATRDAPSTTPRGG